MSAWVSEVLGERRRCPDTGAELTLEQFYEFLKEMEKAKAGLEYLS